MKPLSLNFPFVCSFKLTKTKGATSCEERVIVKVFKSGDAVYWVACKIYKKNICNMGKIRYEIKTKINKINTKKSITEVKVGD